VGSGVFATALSALALGFGPLRAGHRAATRFGRGDVGIAALLVDIYLY
jgi:hypothetical protein